MEQEIIDSTFSLLYEFHDYHPTRLISYRTPKFLDCWEALSDGLVKINVDPAVSEARIGIGVVIRNSSSTVKIVTAQSLPLLCLYIGNGGSNDH